MHNYSRCGLISFIVGFIITFVGLIWFSVTPKNTLINQIMLWTTISSSVITFIIFIIWWFFIPWPREERALLSIQIGKN